MSHLIPGSLTRIEILHQEIAAFLGKGINAFKFLPKTYNSMFAHGTWCPSALRCWKVKTLQGIHSLKIYTILLRGKSNSWKAATPQKRCSNLSSTQISNFPWPNVFCHIFFLSKAFLNLSTPSTSISTGRVECLCLYPLNITPITCFKKMLEKMEWPTMNSNIMNFGPFVGVHRKSPFFQWTFIPTPWSKH